LFLFAFIRISAITNLRSMSLYCGLFASIRRMGPVFRSDVKSVNGMLSYYVTAKRQDWTEAAPTNAHGRGITDRDGHTFGTEVDEKGSRVGVRLQCVPE
jgi:hypothetical protein